MSSSSPPTRTTDWGLGNYEHIAAQLLPAARVVVDRSAPAETERVVRCTPEPVMKPRAGNLAEIPQATRARDHRMFAGKLEGRI